MADSGIDLKSLSTGDLERLVGELEARKAADERQNAFWNYRPAPFQEPWWASQKPIRAIMSANQGGKSTFGCVFTLSKATHALPRALGGDPSRGFPKDVAVGERYLACGESFDQVYTKTLIPKLREYLTDDMLAPGLSANAVLYPPRGGGEVTIRFRSGAELVLMAYQQARQVFEGGVFDGVWFDEEPPEDIWHAVRRGLIRRKGWTVLTATSLDQVYIHDQVILPFQDEEHPRHEYVDVFEAVMHQNCMECHGGYLPHERIMEFAQSITDPAEREARIYGKIRKLEGVNFKYVAPKTHVVPDFEWSRAWPLVEVCDPSMTRGLWVGWFTRDNDGLWYMVQARHIPDGSFAYLAEQLKRARRLLQKEPDLAIMDRRGGKATINKWDETKWFDAFADEGIHYHESAVDSPLETLHDWLEPRWHPRKEAEVPKLRFLRSVEMEEKGPLWALGRFKWGETNKTARQTQRQSQQEPKDWVDVMKYLVSYPGIEELRGSTDHLTPRQVPMVETYSRRARRRRGSAGARGSYTSYPMHRG